MAARKIPIIAIAACVCARDEDEDDNETVYALRADGRIFYYAWVGHKEWREMLPVPDEGDDVDE